MTDTNGQTNQTPEASEPTPPIGSGREASLVLRRQRRGAEDLTSAMETANQSLTDALRLAFFVLKIAMVVLVALFLLSGFQTVSEGQRGIRLVFGRVTGENLEPGPRFAPPYPIGELVRIDVGMKTVRLDRDFWPMIPPEQQTSTFQDLVGKGHLDPRYDGSIITGDGALAHARMSVDYRRARPAQWARRIHPDNEDQMVRSTARWALIKVAGSMRLDDLLKSTGSDVGSIDFRVAREMQSMLDGMESGIQIERVAVQQVVPPVDVRNEFQQVQQAESEQAKNIEAARAEEMKLLNAVAGEAAPYILRAVEAYEDAVEKDAPIEEQEARLAVVFDILEGRPVTLDGELVNPALAGQAGQILAEARQYRTSVAAVRQAQYERFQGVYEQYKSNPEVTIRQAWAGAMREFLDRPNAEVMLIPAGVQTLEMVVKLDLEFRKLAEERRQYLLAEQTKKERERMQAEGQFDTDVNRVIMDAR